MYTHTHGSLPQKLLEAAGGRGRIHIAALVPGMGLRLDVGVGVSAVFGVVVNDALVLLDRYNIIRRENPMLPAIAATSAATRHRFRAVFLPSMTIMVGLSPLLFERREDLVFMVPFIVSMLGGLALSGVFILFVLPALVIVIDGTAE